MHLINCPIPPAQTAAPRHLQPHHDSHPLHHSSSRHTHTRRSRTSATQGRLSMVKFNWCDSRLRMETNKWPWRGRMYETKRPFANRYELRMLFDNRHEHGDRERMSKMCQVCRCDEVHYGLQRRWSSLTQFSKHPQNCTHCRILLMTSLQPLQF